MFLFFLGVFEQVREVRLVGRLQEKIFATRQERIIYTSGNVKTQEGCMLAGRRSGGREVGRVAVAGIIGRSVVESPISSP